MDVLQKEIDEVYATQPTAHETLDYGVVEQHQRFIRSLTEINGGCAVISDLSNRKSYVTVHPWAHFLGLTPEEAALSVIDSMDEDCIYRRIHPEDLVEKRLLEYKFFQKTFSMSPDERLKYRGRCRLRMMNEKGVYQYIDNLVQIMENTPSGNVWLIFCLYSLSADQRPEQGIYATITQMERTVEQRNSCDFLYQCKYCQPPPAEYSGETFCRQLDRSLSGGGIDEIAVILSSFRICPAAYSSKQR